MFDLLIKNANIIDGTGQPAYRANLAILGDRIAAIGEFPARARRIIDASGLTLTPGIIDPHSHADLIAPLPPSRQYELLRGKLAQGVTSAIIGNCGLGCAPIQNKNAETVLRAINAWMTPEPVDWRWRSTDDYMRRLEDNGLSLNIGMLIPHGPVRISAMGLGKGSPSASQQQQMRRMVERGMRDGAFGLSTGLIYPPGMYSAPDELHDLAGIVAAHGGIYTSHIRGSSETLLQAVDELLEVGRATGVRVHHSHNEAVGRAHWAKIYRVLEREETALREGVRVSFDMFPYTAAATMMIAIYPPWSLEGGVDGLIERLSDPVVRRRIRRDVEGKRPAWPPWREGGWPHNLVGATGWDSIVIGYVASRKNKRYENRSLAELGGLTGKDPFEAISDLIVEERGQVSMLIYEVSGERDGREMLAKFARHPLSAFCTDAEDYGRGSPHPAAYGAFARIFARFVREDGVLTIEEAVRKMTSYTATIFGIKDRGAIRPGAFADLVLLDPRLAQDRADFQRPRREATGIKLVVINGRIAFERGEVKDVAAGRVLRR
ncbi:MAG: D-aminoacylase [Blastocatellales bacterium]|nr:D-aminoacylase [Blastocatellales bacterium]